MNKQTWKNRAAIIVLSFIGSFLIYCGQSAMNNSDGGVILPGMDATKDMLPMDMVKDAKADHEPPQFTKLLDFGLNVDSGTLESSEIDVSGYREVVVYDAGATPCSTAFQWQFSASSDSPFGYVSTTGLGARRVLGTRMKIKLNTNSLCGKNAFRVIVAGIK